ncbi:hypothetical protein JY547_07410 [Serratia marcescens]|nr:hypothetical protein [Serratia marcescens]
MGKISERLKYARIDEGFCQICGARGKLSRDHVPPKSVFPTDEIEQKLITELLSVKEIKGVSAKHGSVFKTICRECNGFLSVFDSEIVRFTRAIDNKIKAHLENPTSISNIVAEHVDAKKYLRGMIGHILSAVPNKACEHPPIESDFYTPLREFVLGDNDEIERTHSIYYWFYPHKVSVSGAGFAVMDTSLHHDFGQSFCACLYFYPVALLVVMKDKNFSEISELANRLNLTDKRMYLNISAKNKEMTVFPFFGLRSTIMAMDHSFITVSYRGKGSAIFV